MRWRAGWVAGLLLAAVPPPAVAQAPLQRQLAARALDMERSGNFAGAVNAYRAILAEEPRGEAALLGLERALTALGRLPEMTADLGAALAADAPGPVVLGIAVRVHVAAGDADGAARAVARWAAAEPGSEAPWQEWGMAAVARQDFEAGRQAFLRGRERLGDGALSAELAQVASVMGDVRTAAREWVVTVGRQPVYQAGAVAMLAQAEAARRPELLRELEGMDTPVAARLAGYLLARWGDPAAGLDRVLATLPAEGPVRRDELQSFLGEVAGLPVAGARATEARVHEALAVLVPGAEAGVHWLEAAQAYSDAGDSDAARRMLARLGGDAAVPREVAGAATLTLVGVLVDEGRLEEAEAEFGALQDVLQPEDRERLARRLAEGWLRAGRLERAALAAAADSSQEGFDLAGRIRLYQGDLAGAADLLRVAGPYAGTREDANRRLGYLALLQVIGLDSLPALGEGLFLLERGDSSAAAARLEAVAAPLPPEAGGAELRLLAGRIVAAQGNDAAAMALLEGAVAPAAPAAAAAATLELARLEQRAGRLDAARGRVETLLLTWPTSAVAPEARRLLDQLRGGVPGAGR